MPAEPRVEARSESRPWPNAGPYDGHERPAGPTRSAQIPIQMQAGLVQ